MGNGLQMNSLWGERNAKKKLEICGKSVLGPPSWSRASLALRVSRRRRWTAPRGPQRQTRMSARGKHKVEHGSSRFHSSFHTMVFIKEITTVNISVAFFKSDAFHEVLRTHFDRHKRLLKTGHVNICTK